ncbi:AraC family transcriptional regulator [Paenibacillus lemnae]|nr:AraC family transcriptional regulator [Paenibacillus lemnae]
MKLQLIVIFFCVMAVPAVILTWYSGEQVLRNSEHAIAESSLAELNANRELIEHALNNLVQNTVRLTSTHVFDRIRTYDTFMELNSSYSTVSGARAVLQELLNLNRTNEGIDSSFFHLSDSDYVISTDKGIKKLERYDSIDWISDALSRHRGIAGVWYPRKLDSGINVMSYVLPLNRLSTTTRGVLVINLKESQIGSLFHSAGTGQQEYMLLNAEGMILSHSDKAKLLQNAAEQPVVQDIVRDKASEGYKYVERMGERLLYTWSRSGKLGWMNVNIDSVNTLMAGSHAVQRDIMLLTAIIVLCGTVLAVILATWVSRPVRELVRAMGARSSLGTGIIQGKNELNFLDKAFKRMQEEEEVLNRLLQVREQDAHNLAVHRMIRGETAPQADELFPDKYFMAVIVSIDRYRNYISKTNPETRSYHRYHIISDCEDIFRQEGIRARSIYHGDGCFVIVLNFGFSDEGSPVAAIQTALNVARKQAGQLLGNSVTIGVSSQADRSEMLADCVSEAMEAIKQGMVVGSGEILYWEDEAVRDKKYIYPVHSERRILNFLDKGDLKGIARELQIIGNEIRSADYVSYDNIVFIYYQLAGVTMKHLRENNVSTARIFTGRGNIYATLAAMDTLDELEEYLYEFFDEIVQYFTRSSGEANHHLTRIVQYLKEHYHKEIVFEDMARDVGISYSHMRRIVYELTGKSLNDYLNHLRVERAKELLRNSPLTITQIASEVGYYNAQSFNRFFKKFEGISPSAYKMTQIE